MKKTLLALIIILAVATMSMGTTFGGFSDTEEVTENIFETGSLDLKVARAGDLEYREDKPYGTGLFPVEDEEGEFVTDEEGEIVTVPCFAEETTGSFADSYQGDFRLWNAGTTHGKFYVHIRDVVAEPSENAETLLTGTDVTIWYDLDNEGDTDEGEVVTGTLAELNCQSVPQEPVVWLLPAEGVRSLQITIDPPAGSPGDSLTFNIQFGLKGIFFHNTNIVPIGFCDTEVCLDNYLRVEE